MTDSYINELMSTLPQEARMFNCDFHPYASGDPLSDEAMQKLPGMDPKVFLTALQIKYPSLEMCSSRETLTSKLEHLASHADRELARLGTPPHPTRAVDYRVLCSTRDKIGQLVKIINAI